MTPQGRDAQAARAKAADRVEKARLIATAVDAFHTAADEIDQAQATIAQSSAARAAALHAIRDAGLSISEIAELTGLSASRVQALVRGENGHVLHEELVSTGEPSPPAGAPPA